MAKTGTKVPSSIWFMYRAAWAATSPVRAAQRGPLSLAFLPETLHQLAMDAWQSGLPATLRCSASKGSGVALYQAIGSLTMRVMGCPPYTRDTAAQAPLSAPQRVPQATTPPLPKFISWGGMKLKGSPSSVRRARNAPSQQP